MNATRTKDTKDTFLTPPEILETARRMRNSAPFGLDPATNVNNPTAARVICIAPQVIITPYSPGLVVHPASHVAMDGLAQNWAELADGGMVWLNPPFGRAKVDFLKKAAEEYRRGAEIQVIIPCDPATGWWQDHCSPRLSTARGVCFLRRRPTFLDPETGKPVVGKDGKPQGPQFGCNIIYFGDRIHDFRDVWWEMGDVDVFR
jgi:hypothetical protein